MDDDVRKALPGQYDLLLLGGILSALSRMGHGVTERHAIAAARRNSMKVSDEAIRTAFATMQRDSWRPRLIAESIVDEMERRAA